MSVAVGKAGGFVARHPHLCVVIVLATLVLLFPVFVRSPYLLGLGIVAGAMAAGTVGFVLPIGYAHQLVLGQAAFCMIGGYPTAILVTRYGWDPFAAMLAGAALSAAVAWAVGRPILRLRGFVLALASLALQLILAHAARELEFTGQALGVSGIPKFAVFGWAIQSDLAYYLIVWLIVLGFALIGLNIERTGAGRALKTVGMSEPVAASLGVDISRAKLEMFVISAAMASVSGSLTVHYLRVMEPSVFDFHFSLNIVTAVVVGGLASVWGGITGAMLFVALRESLRALGYPHLDTLLMALASVVMLIALPNGLAGAVTTAFRRLTAGASRQAPDAAPAQLQAPVPAVHAAPGGSGRPVLSVHAVSRSFGALRAVENVSFDVLRGSITAVIGPNGAGKTTLFNLINGFEPLDRGSVELDGAEVGELSAERIARLGMGRTFQTPKVVHGLTITENVMCGGHRHLQRSIVAASLGSPGVAAEERRIRARAAAGLARVGLRADIPVEQLSFGQQRQLELARALSLEPELLLMDEPASGLNDSETEALAQLIAGINASGVTILLIEHDLRVVMGLADKVVVLNHGEVIAQGTPDEVRRDPAVIAAYLGRDR